MARTKKVKVVFYEVKHRDTRERPFEEILRVATGFPPGQDRTVVYRDQVLHLKELRLYEAEGFWLGDVSRIRLEDNMTLSDLNGEEEELPGGDRGPCEKSSFLFYPATRTFLFGEFGIGPSASAIAAASVSSRSCRIPTLLR